MTNKPLISVIITNYNYGEYVGQAIESALNQTYKNLEIIIINDGSTDDSDAVIREYAEKNPQIIYINRGNRGANISRNEGMTKASGEYVFLLDADNWLNANHVDSLYKKLVSSNADVVYSNLKHFGMDQEMVELPEFDIEILKVTNFVDTSSLIRKQSLGKNRFDPWLNRKSSQDWDFFLGLALKGLKIVKAGGVALNYRVHDKQHGNSFRTVAKINQSIEVYNYITSKYYKLFPDQFSNQVRWTNSLVSEYARTKRLTLEQDQEISEKNREIAAILNSLTYKTGRAIISPLRWLRNSLRRA